MLFDNIPRTGYAGRRPDEGQFNYLNTSARPEAERVRSAIQDWLQRVPVAHRGELRSRIRGSDKVFASATFELFLHELCLRQGWQVEIHPTLSNGQRKHPDFLVEAPNGKFYLEAVLASQLSDDQEAAEQRKNSVLRAIDDLPSPNFLLEIDPIGAPLTPVPAKRLKRELRQWLDSLDPVDIRERYENRGELPVFIFEHAGWQISFRPIPRKTGGQGRQTIGLLGGEVRTVEVIPAIRKAARRKGSKYGNLDLPLLVAINVAEDWADVTQERDALFGMLQLWVNPVAGITNTRRLPDGVWHGPQGPTYTRMSGIWLFRHLDMWHWASRGSNLIYLNPFANHPLSDDIRVFPHAEVVGGKIVEHAGTPFHQILGVPEDWPIQPAFPAMG